jgi:hypothetical protein
VPEVEHLRARSSLRRLNRAIVGPIARKARIPGHGASFRCTDSGMATTTSSTSSSLPTSCPDRDRAGCALAHAEVPGSGSLRADRRRGFDDFGQSGDVQDLYGYFGIDTNTIVGAAIDMLDASQ